MTKKVLVVGDSILDVYLRGIIKKHPSEGQVFEVLERRWVPGGAANAALHARGPATTVFLAGALGNDAEGGTLKNALPPDIHPFLWVDPERPTTTKIRLSPDFPRIDFEKCHPFSADLQKAIGAHCRAITPDVLLLSDYKKGVFSSLLLTDLLFGGAFLSVVDPKPPGFQHYAGATVLTPNLHEALQMTGCTHPEDAAALLLTVARMLSSPWEKMGAFYIVLAKSPCIMQQLLLPWWKRWAQGMPSVGP